jgi:secreted PhoX family phosphatase
MSAPLIYIGTNRMKAGMLEGYRRNFMPELLKVVETNEPRILGFHAFANEDGTEITGVQVHPDADSMLFHMQVVSEKVTMAYDQYIDATTDIQVYGPPNDAVLEMMRRLATPGVSVRIKADHVAGFTRLQSP